MARLRPPRPRRLPVAVVATAPLAFNDSSDFVTPGANEETFANPAGLPRYRDQQTLVQQELERARGISFETRSLLPSFREVWRAEGSPSRRPPAAVLDLVRRRRSVVVARRAQRLPLRSPTSRLFVSRPRSVSFCIRRKARREVLFALRIGGSRGLGRNGVRRNLNSHWRC